MRTPHEHIILSTNGIRIKGARRIFVFSRESSEITNVAGKDKAASAGERQGRFDHLVKAWAARVPERQVPDEFLSNRSCGSVMIVYDGERWPDVWSSGSVLFSGVVLAKMLRHSIATLLVLTFLPVPGFSRASGSWIAYFGVFRSMAVTASGCDDRSSSIADRSSGTDAGLPHDEDLFCESDLEITEGEGAEKGKSESIDFASTFARQAISNFRNRNFVRDCDFLSLRISNSNELFRILRC